MQGSPLKVDSKLFKLENLKAFDAHSKVEYLCDKESGLEGFIAIHRKYNSHPSFGATRVWHYETKKDALKDALRLSKLMSYKSALAGLECGGAKAVLLFDPEGNRDKSKILEKYAEEVNKLEGAFVTGTDVGLTQAEIVKLQRTSPYFVGLRVNPTVYTAFGVLCAIQCALEFKCNSRKLTGKTFAIQGLGKIGSHLLGLIYGDAKDIYVTDIDMRLLRKMKTKYPRVRVVEPDEIHKCEVDVYAPCALSFALNHKTTPEISASIVGGGANNQLSEDGIADELLKRDILYIPDYVANAGGLISVVSEYYNKDIGPDILMEHVAEIGTRTAKILKESAKENRSTHLIANTMAERIILKNGK